MPADVSSFTIDGLQADSSYTVLVSPVIGSREGSPSTLVIRTGTRVFWKYCCLLLEGTT